MKFMKKTVFCVALVAALFLAVPANAQFKFGPDGYEYIHSFSQWKFV